MQLSTEFVGDAGLIRVRGDVDVIHAPKLHQAGTEMLNDGARSLVIDCRDIEFIASDGLEVMIRLNEEAHTQGGTLTVRRPTSFFCRLMEITRLDTMLIIDGLSERPDRTTAD